jgi:hypothetical protein
VNHLDLIASVRMELVKAGSAGTDLEVAEVLALRVLAMDRGFSPGMVREKPARPASLRLDDRKPLGVQP